MEMEYIGAEPTGYNGKIKPGTILELICKEETNNIKMFPSGYMLGFRGLNGSGFFGYCDANQWKEVIHSPDK